MERDPIPFAWRAAPKQHAAAIGLGAGLGVPLVLLALLCLRDLVRVLTDPDAPATFLALLLPLPGTEGQVLVAWRGWALASDVMPAAALLGLALSALAAAGLGWMVARLCVTAQSRTTARLRARATEAILRAPPATREDMRALPQLVARTLSAMGPLPALGLVAPALAASAVAVVLVVAEMAAPRLVPAVVLSLLAATLARIHVLRREADRAALRAQEIAATEGDLSDLIRRMPAVRTHGAAAFERRRLGLRARAARNVLGQAERTLASARAPALALAVLVPSIVVATALWRDPVAAPALDRAMPGALAAIAAAFTLAMILIDVCLRLWRVRSAALPEFRAIARILDGLDGRAPGKSAPTAFPGGDALDATGLAAYDPATGERLVGVELSLPMPAHVAILGERGAGARALAAVLAGQLEPTAGRVAYGGIDLRTLDSTERARRIALAGTEAILIEGTLRQNLLYGARSEDREASGLADRIAILKLAGLDAFVYARGLGAAVDPEAEPAAAAAIVKARHSVRAALDAEGIARLVEPFDPDRYNHQATLGENILFGEPVGPAFAEARRASHPYLKAVAEAEGLTAALTEVGLQVARNTVEIFADLPDDHALFDAFSLFPAADRGFFEDLVARQPEAKGWRRGPAGQRDRERLIGLALRYSEVRHRFGLIDAGLEARLVAARRSFAGLLPSRFRGQIEFYDPARLTAAASLEENVLFGRITQGEAGAEARVRALVRRVLAEDGLESTVYRLGLATRVDPLATGGGPGRGARGEGGIGPKERVAIDLVRCLVRRPDILVVGPGLDERTSKESATRLAGLRALRRESGLIVCLSDPRLLDGQPPFDAVLEVARNTVGVRAEMEGLAKRP